MYLIRQTLDSMLRLINGSSVGIMAAKAHLIGALGLRLQRQKSYWLTASGGIGEFLFHHPILLLPSPYEQSAQLPEAKSIKRKYFFVNSGV